MKVIHPIMKNGINFNTFDFDVIACCTTTNVEAILNSSYKKYSIPSLQKLYWYIGTGLSDFSAHSNYAGSFFHFSLRNWF